MGIENFVVNRKVVEDKIRNGELSGEAYNLYINIAKHSEQINPYDPANSTFH